MNKPFVHLFRVPVLLDVPEKDSSEQRLMDPIIIKGTRFFYKNSGAQFFMKGIYYQDHRDTLKNSTSFVDPLEDGARCARDVAYLRQLSINSLYIPFIRAEASHTACMSIFQDAGIYILVDFETLSDYIDNTGNWDHSLYQRFIRVINSLDRFSNLLGFWISGDIRTIPLLKAAVRDSKEYMQDTGHRTIPVGAFVDSGSNAAHLTEYLTCGERSTTIDFLLYSLVPGRKCPDFLSHMRQDLESLESVHSSVPLVLMTMPCNITELVNEKMLISAYAENYTTTHSGTIFLPYFNTSRSKTFWPGMVEIKDNSVSPLPEFSAVSSQMAQIQPSSIAIALYTPTQTVPIPCGSTLTYIESDTGDYQSTKELQVAAALPPKPDARLCSCMMDSLGCIDNGEAALTSELLNFNVMDTKNKTKEASLFRTLCSQDQTHCLGTAVNTTTGKYGAFSVCNSTERVSWMLNHAYKDEKNISERCTPGGGVVQVPEKNPSRACLAMLRQAGPDGTGVVLRTPLTEGSDHKGGMGEQARVAIGVGVTALTLILTALTLWILHKKRRRQFSPHHSETFEKNELPDNYIIPPTKEIVELEGSERFEIGGTGFLEKDSEPVAEMPTIHNEYLELDAKKKESY